MGESQKKVVRGGKRKGPIRFARYGAVLVILAVVPLLAGFQAGRMKSIQAKWTAAAAALVASPDSSPARKTDLEIAEISRLAPQQQAEILLERAIHRSDASLDLILQHVDTWRGRLQSTDRLFDLVITALKSDDLRVRVAAVEIDLAASNLSKSAQSVTRLVQQLRDDPAGRPLALWRLGALGNRGVEPKTVLATLLRYAHNRDEHARFWAAEGLAMLGSDASISPLLDIFAHDPSPRVRQRAACSLAESGMLTPEQRLTAVPHLLNFLDDDSLNAATRGLVYGALRVITGAAIGNDVKAWREWWAHHDTVQKKPSRPASLLRA